MSGRGPERLDPEDLIARARRGLLSQGEQRELARALDESADARVAYQVGRDLDRATAVRGGDEALIARAAETALARVQGACATAARSRSRARGAGLRLPAAAALVLALLSASGIATAWWTGLVSWPFPRAQSARPAAESEPAAVRAKPERRARAVAPETVRVPASPVPAAERVPAAIEDERAFRPRRPSAGASAAERFHAANNARRNGEYARAERLYQELVAAHPGSDESGLARVSLGKLRLARGDASGAEAEFRKYLAAGRGQLAEEALVGRAQALGRLGRTGAERDAWQRLLAGYPGSVYAAQARSRLLALQAQHAEDGPR